jgi:hypothetical protein
VPPIATIAGLTMRLLRRFAHGRSGSSRGLYGIGNLAQGGCGFLKAGRLCLISAGQIIGGGLNFLDRAHDTACANANRSDSLHQ